MLIRKSIIIAMALSIMLIPSISAAVDLRGRIDGRNQYTGAPYPIGGANVSLFIQTPGGWQPVATYMTGFDGMYFFRNIFPGYYVLQINGRQNYPITVFNQPFQDLPPVVIQY